MTKKPADRSPVPTPATDAEAQVERIVPLVVRSGIGGVLMGLANLVPGISGGTMLLAVGIYPRFIAAISEVTRLRFRRLSLIILASVGGAAVLAIAGLAGVVKDLVVEHRWIMYAVFIGLTLGGVPLVWRLMGRRRTVATWLGALAGLVGMTALALAQAGGGGGVSREGFWFMVFAGIAGASAMILPGISGGYLLLVLGVYVPILAGIDVMKTSLETMQLDLFMQVAMGMALPIGIGVVVGVVAVSNLLRWLLDHYRQPTLGVLLGLLLGAVVGLWPFQHSVPPIAGDVIKGQAVLVDAEGILVLSETGQALEREDYPTAFFRPAPRQVAAALGLILAGFLATLAIDRLGGSTRAEDED